jgi:hypothetical protein
VVIENGEREGGGERERGLNMCCHVGAPTSPPCGEEGLGGETRQEAYSSSRASSLQRLSQCCDWFCRSAAGLAGGLPVSC